MFKYLLPIAIFILFLGCNNSSNSPLVEPYSYQQWYLEKNETFYKMYGIDTQADIHVGNILNQYSGKGVKVAIIDNGFTLEHEDLNSNNIHTYNLSNTTTSSHATAISGIIAAQHNGKGIRGIAPDVELLFLEKAPISNEDELLELFSKAQEENVDIINCSWNSLHPSQKVKDKIIQLTKTARNGKGMVIVFAAGNEQQQIENSEASLEEVIVVGSTNSLNQQAWYSNYGQSLDLLAPGGDTLGITTLDRYKKYLFFNDENHFVGTSASTAIVSGIVALMLEKNKNLTSKEVEEILKQSADKIGPYPYVNNKNIYYGYGKLNASKALSLVK